MENIIFVTRILLQDSRCYDDVSIFSSEQEARACWRTNIIYYILEINEFVPDDEIDMQHKNELLALSDKELNERAEKRHFISEFQAWRLD